jgi:hypothetical protein
LEDHIQPPGSVRRFEDFLIASSECTSKRASKVVSPIEAHRKFDSFSHGLNSGHSLTQVGSHHREETSPDAKLTVDLNEVRRCSSEFERAAWIFAELNSYRKEMSRVSMTNVLVAPHETHGATLPIAPSEVLESPSPLGLTT